LKISIPEELDRIRSEIRDITSDIIRKVQRRNELSKQIGAIKKKLNFDVKDEKVEQDIRTFISKLSNEIGIDPDFAGRLLNILLAESLRLQLTEQHDSTQFESHLAVFMKAKKLESSGKKIIHMEVGEPDYPPPESVRKALSNVFESRQYHYSETKGITKLRTSIAQTIGNHITTDKVIVTPGGRFAVFVAIASLLTAGDELICIEPAWPAYRECAAFVGSTTNILKTTLEEDWNPNIRKLESMINGNTKMIALNYPNNPTGRILNKSIMEKIVSLAKDHRIYVLSDEVYRDYVFTEFTSVLEYRYEKSIVISSFSKGHAMTGFRVGYAIAEENLIDKMAKVQATALTSVAEPMQYAALAAIEDSSAENAKRIKRRLEIISDKLREMSLRFVRPDGAMYVYPELGIGKSDVEFVQKALDLGVAVAPGSGFGDCYAQFIRISACQPDDQLEKGLELLKAAMSSC
jgi:aspartate aminotransferase